MNIDSFSSSQEFFLHFGIWKNHSKQLTLEPNLGDQNLVKFGTQHLEGVNLPFLTLVSKSAWINPETQKMSSQRAKT